MAGSEDERTWFFGIGRTAILVSSVLLMLPGALGHSVTSVEFAQLPAGLAAWSRHSLGIYRVCGPLSKLLYALPAHLAGIKVNYPASFDSDTRNRPEWTLGDSFQVQNHPRYHNLYRWSRIVPILVTALGGYLVWEWSNRLSGRCSAIVSLCAWCWTPPLLAHGSLVTSDMLAAVMAILAARSFWAFLVLPRWPTALLAGLALGLAGSTKFTLLMFYPCWGILLIARVVQLRKSRGIEPSRGSVSSFRFALLGTSVLSISIITIDTIYLFKNIGFCLLSLHPIQSSLMRGLHRLGDRAETAWLLQVPLPIPLELVRGMDFQLADVERPQLAYLMGQFRLGGWWYWYLFASVIKVPLPVLTLLILSIGRFPTTIQRNLPAVWAALCTLIPAAEMAVTIATTTGTGNNATFRYLIPSLALLCIWSGHIWTASSRAFRVVIVALLSWLLVNAMSAMPDHLGWQNEIGQICSRERPALLGDNLDWGQDLARLGEWVSRHSAAGSTIVCVYGFGTAEPYGLRAPYALPMTVPWERPTFLAVSDLFLFAKDPLRSVGIAGEHSTLSASLKASLLHLKPFDRVGRTIRIYRLRDVEQMRDQRVGEDPLRGITDP